MSNLNTHEHEAKQVILDNNKTVQDFYDEGGLQFPYSGLNIHGHSAEQVILNNNKTVQKFYDEIDSYAQGQEKIRVSAIAVDRTLTVGAVHIISSTFKSGNPSMHEGGRRFVAPVSGLYVFCASSTLLPSNSGSNPGTTWVGVSKNNTDVTTDFSDSAWISSVGTVSNLTHVTWLDEGEFLTYHMSSTVAQSSIMAAGMRLSFEFALLNSWAGE